ncbi:5100_t:CDS:2, partial [Entrophospora sp. SA101]
NKLQKELETISSESLVCEGLLVTTEKENVDYKNFMVLLIEYKKTKQQLYNANRQIKRLKEKLNKFEHKQDEEDNSDYENQEELLRKTINDIIEESKLGSTILISTEQFLSLILQQSCSYCGESHLPNKKTKASTAGFVVKIHVKCKLCKTVIEFINESETNFNTCVAAAGLVGGTNRQSLQMILACVGITSQLCKTSFHEHQGKTFKEIIKASETSANIVLQKLALIALGLMYRQSGEMIYDGSDIEGYLYKPIIAFHVVEKPRKMKMENGKEVIVQEGNFELSSCQMEHAILIALIEKLTPILEEEDVLLNVTIDGDLDSNKTLGNVGIVNQIFPDLKH